MPPAATTTTSQENKLQSKDNTSQDASRDLTSPKSLATGIYDHANEPTTTLSGSKTYSAKGNHLTSHRHTVISNPPELQQRYQTAARDDSGSRRQHTMAKRALLYLRCGATPQTPDEIGSQIKKFALHISARNTYDSLNAGTMTGLATLLLDDDRCKDKISQKKMRTKCNKSLQDMAIVHSHQLTASNHSLRLTLERDSNLRRYVSKTHKKQRCNVLLF